MVPQIPQSCANRNAMPDFLSS
jgi:hypothetical protein